MPVPSKLVMAILNDQFIEIDGLKNQVTGNYFNGAVVLAYLYDPSGQLSIPEVNGLVCAYVPNSNGMYRGPVANSFNPVVGTGYRLLLNIAAGPFLANVNVAVEVVNRRT